MNYSTNSDLIIEIGELLFQEVLITSQKQADIPHRARLTILARKVYNTSITVINEAIDLMEFAYDQELKALEYPLKKSIWPMDPVMY